MISNKDIVLSRLEEFKNVDLKPLEDFLNEKFKDKNYFYFKCSFKPLKEIIFEESQYCAVYVDRRFVPFIINTVRKW